MNLVCPFHQCEPKGVLHQLPDKHGRLRHHRSHKVKEHIVDSLNLLALDLGGENDVENFRVLAGRRFSRQFEEFSPVLTLVSPHDLTYLLPFSYNADLSYVGLISFLLICNNQRWIQLSALSALFLRPTSESKSLHNISNFTSRFLMSDISEVVGWLF